MTQNELALVLYASVAHPDELFRDSLRQRLDAAIDSMEPDYPRPVHKRNELRRLYYKLDRHHKGGVVLGPMLRELVLRLSLLAFTKPRDNRRCRLLVAGDESSREKSGYVIDTALKVIDLRRSSLTRHRMNRQQSDCRFLVAPFQRRLGEIQRQERQVEATLRVEDKLILELRGSIPWNVNGSNSRGRPGVDGAYPGWEHEGGEHRLRLWPGSPEATLRLTAGMATNRTFAIREPFKSNGGVIVVQLRDFDGDAIDLRATVSRSQTEPWLRRIPAPPLELSQEDRLAIARWAYPIPEWLQGDFAERLM